MIRFITPPGTRHLLIPLVTMTLAGSAQAQDAPAELKIWQETATWTLTLVEGKALPKQGSLRLIDGSGNKIDVTDLDQPVQLKARFYTIQYLDAPNTLTSRKLASLHQSTFRLSDGQGFTAEFRAVRCVERDSNVFLCFADGLHLHSQPKYRAIYLNVKRPGDIQIFDF